MKVRKLTICLTVALLSFAARAQQAPADVHRVALCDVVHNPKEYTGMRIGIEASVVNDKGKSPILTSYCTFGIRAVIDDSSKSDRNVTEFSKLLERGPIGTGHTDVSGTFIGKFEVSDSDSSYKLRLDHVEKMTVKRY